ncbi:hypothetical protein SEA_LITTLETOKYO_47 [Arthrobacter phage LittleTokyo]|nr:hypothetical protein SEA_LITTLETOKYO_47 [Arthrobacter phage LittleTokyo]
MTDVKRAWSDAEVRRVAAHADRVAVMLGELADRWVTLRLGLVPGVAGRDSDELVVHKPAGPRVPLSLDVVDVREEVALFVRDFLPRVRLAMRLRGAVRGAGDVRPGLLLMARMLPGLYSRDRALGDEIAAAACELHRRAAWAAGEVPRPFALADECGACGLRSLWAVPERMVVRCGNPACGESWPVSSPLPVTSD